jgi:hypothetical protein
MRPSLGSFSVLAALLAAGCGSVSVEAPDFAPLADPGRDARKDVADAPDEDADAWFLDAPLDAPLPPDALDALDAADTPALPDGGCVRDSDCAHLATKPCDAAWCDPAGVCRLGTGCDDGNPCTIDSCDPLLNRCRYENLNEGPCDDGNLCTIGDGCFAGQCTGAVLACDDKDDCTLDACDPAVGCDHVPLDQTPCEDGDLCTKDDLCYEGECASGAYPLCDDGNPCTNDGCDPATGSCAHSPNAKTCDDHDPCTTDDRCTEGLCGGTANVSCDDGESCTIDYCESPAGCMHKIAPSCLKCTLDAECDDGNPCTTETCADGTCRASPLDGKPCDDGSVCTSGDQCLGGSCTGGNSSSCDDGNTCTFDTCDPVTGACQHYVQPAINCDDGNACTIYDTCTDGVCVGVLYNCSDGNACTDDRCNPLTGACEFPSNTASCSDANPCTTADACSGGTCTGIPVKCDDGNPCTIDSCDPKAGCVNTPMPACGSCKTAADCDDKNPCTTENCTNGNCVFAPVKDATACEDGSACTTGDTCKSGRCESGKPRTCDDGNPCTTDSCDPGVGCVQAFHELPCDDGDACTAPDLCYQGFCASGPAIPCDDGNPCTTDTCNPATGCAHVEAAIVCVQSSCSGLVYQPSSTCKAGACPSAPAVPCDDGNPCTDDGCSATKGCTHVPNSVACSDGNACTTGDKCSQGACVPGAPRSCDDQSSCTSDSCDPSTGCLHVNLDIPCEDGDLCKVDDWCVAGKCQSGKTANCDDGNPCTDDKCLAWLGCNHDKAAEGTTCNDGNACTVSDRCQSGVCKGDGKDCNDGNPCTADQCDPSLQKCTYTPVAGACSDGNPCTVGDTCSAGVCVPGTPTVCSDQNPCTRDACNPTTGQCDFLPDDSGTCGDSNACTTGDTCSGGSCRGTGTLDCNDGRACTLDSCSPTTGCLNDNLCTAPNPSCTAAGCQCCGKTKCITCNSMKTDSCVLVYDPTSHEFMPACLCGTDTCSNIETCCDGVCDPFGC